MYRGDSPRGHWECVRAPLSQCPGSSLTPGWGAALCPGILPSGGNKRIPSWSPTLQSSEPGDKETEEGTGSTAPLAPHLPSTLVHTHIHTALGQKHLGRGGLAGRDPFRCALRGTSAHSGAHTKVHIGTRPQGRGSQKGTCTLILFVYAVFPSPPTYLHFQIFPLISHQAQGLLPVTVSFLSTLFSLPMASLQVRPGELEEIRI